MRSPLNGLTKDEAQIRLEREGLDKLPSESKWSDLFHFAPRFDNVLTYVLPNSAAIVSGSGHFSMQGILSVSCRSILSLFFSGRQSQISVECIQSHAFIAGASTGAAANERWNWLCCRSRTISRAAALEVEFLQVSESLKCAGCVLEERCWFAIRVN